MIHKHRYCVKWILRKKVWVLLDFWEEMLHGLYLEEWVHLGMCGWADYENRAMSSDPEWRKSMNKMNNRGVTYESGKSEGCK